MSVESLVSAAAAAVLAVAAATASGGGPATSGAGVVGRSTTAVAAPGQAWEWPIEPQPSVLAAFDPPDERWGRGHRGVDLGAEVGQPVRAPADGRVTFAGTIAGRGVVVVAHDGGLRSTFEPVRGQAVVGAVVRAGDAVAVVTATPGHCAPATCLHWGVLRGDTYLDPLSFLTRRPIVLLPLR